MSDTPSKADQLRALITELEDHLKLAAGGVDERVQGTLQKMKEVLPPAA